MITSTRRNSFGSAQVTRVRFNRLVGDAVRTDDKGFQPRLERFCKLEGLAQEYLRLLASMSVVGQNLVGRFQECRNQRNRNNAKDDCNWRLRLRCSFVAILASVADMMTGPVTHTCTYLPPQFLVAPGETFRLPLVAVRAWAGKVVLLLSGYMG